MAGNKRKRTSASASHAEETSETASTDVDTVNGTIPVAENVFDVKVFHEGKTSPKKGKSGQGSVLSQQPGWDSTDKPIHYQINPRTQWDGLKKYQKFVVSNKTFGTGDFVYIYHGNEAQGANLDVTASRDCWIAKVLEIRAHGPSHVYLRVLWLYWPEELPKEGRKDYHSSLELVASNHMEIMDAMTVTDRAEVAHVTEDYTEPPAEGLFWRQKLDVLNGRLSNLRRDCRCNGFHNPEKKLINCQTCKKWLHEVCLLEEALKQFSLKSEKKEIEAETKTTGDEGDAIVATSTTAPEADATPEAASDTIKVDESFTIEPQFIPDSQASTTAPTPKPNGTPSTGRKLRKTQSRKSLPSASSSTPGRAKKRAVEAPWAGKLEARLELEKAVDEQGEETETATGKVIITDLNADVDGEREYKEELRCLCCGANLADTTAE